MGRSNIDVDVTTLSDGTATVAKVYVWTPEFVFRGFGSSRRLPEDVNDSELGRLLALKRALDGIVTSIDAKTKRLIAVNDKKRNEAQNWRSKEQWEQFQAEQLAAAKKAHPAGKTKKAKK